MKPKQPDSEVRRNLSKRWYNMMDRCYNHNHPRYKDYGAAGVTVSEEWRDKETFIDSVKNLPGYDEKDLLSGRLHLDKDTVVPGNKEYSSDACVFIDQSLNNAVKPNQMRDFIAESPAGDVSVVSNQSVFAAENDLAQGKISECLKGKRSHHKGWTFRYKE